MRTLRFADGAPVLVSGAERAFPQVSRIDGQGRREYAWAMVDLLARLAIAIPVESPSAGDLGPGDRAKAVTSPSSGTRRKSDSRQRQERVASIANIDANASENTGADQSDQDEAAVKACSPADQGGQG